MMRGNASAGVRVVSSMCTRKSMGEAMAKGKRGTKGVLGSWSRAQKNMEGPNCALPRLSACWQGCKAFLTLSFYVAKTFSGSL